MSAAAFSNLPLFVFGTLMDEDVLRAVLGHSLPKGWSEPARIDGWRRRIIAARTYPMLHPHPTGSVTGLLLRDLPERDRDRLDFYEGPEYRLGIVTVRTAAGEAVTALAYLCPDGVAAGRQEWRLDTWRLRHKRAALARIRTLMAAWRP